MKENKYDDEAFFDRYARMDRSVRGLAGAGEWQELLDTVPGMDNELRRPMMMLVAARKR